MYFPFAEGDSLGVFVSQMTKKIKKLEKETAMYRSRWESSNKALLEMAEEVKQIFVFAVKLKTNKLVSEQHWSV